MFYLELNTYVHTCNLPCSHIHGLASWKIRGLDMKSYMVVILRYYLVEDVAHIKYQSWGITIMKNHFKCDRINLSVALRNVTQWQCEPRICVSSISLWQIQLQKVSTMIRMLYVHYWMWGMLSYHQDSTGKTIFYK